MFFLKFRKAYLATVSAFVAFFLIINPIITVIVYEGIFARRFETPEYLRYSLDDFQGLKAEEFFIENDGGVKLASYKYYYDEEPKGYLMFSHGLGGGGHNFYLPVIEYFARAGFFVYTYDATGNDLSEGETVKGIPQFYIDAKTVMSYIVSVHQDEKPISVMGHSCGAYAAACLLGEFPQIDAAAILSGFDRSEDMLVYQSSKYIGKLTDVLFHTVDIYEDIKFSREDSDRSAIESVKNSDARVLIAHSSDDETVPTYFLFDKLYAEYSQSDRFDFKLFSDRGHTFIFYSDNSVKYRNEMYVKYPELVGEVRDEAVITAFNKYVDKKQCFELDTELFDKFIYMIEI